MSSKAATETDGSMTDATPTTLLDASPSTPIMMASLLTKATRLSVRIVVDKRHEQQYHDFTISIADLQARELEMHRVAAAYNVSGQRWNGSRLYNDYMEYCLEQNDELLPDDDDDDDDDDDENNKDAVIQLTVDPIQFCRDNHLCRELVWTQELTTLLGEFYATSLMQVGEVGLPFLLALEYFGILYQPDQLVFQSLQAYKLVKEWSDYLAQRSYMADWIAEQILVARGTAVDYYFATCPRITMDGQEIAVICHDESNTNDPHIVGTFFNASETKSDKQRDFCYLLECLMPIVRAGFMGSPAVLHIRVKETTMARTAAVSARNRRGKGTRSLHGEDDCVDDEKKTNDELVYANSSPRRVSDVDAARADFYESRSTPPRASGEKVMERSAPKITHEMVTDKQMDDITVTRDQKKKRSSSRPWRKDVRRPSLPVRPRNKRKPSAPAPVLVIRARSADVSVQSALTGPLFLDGSVVRDVFENSNEVKAEALRQEWIQSSVLNRGLSTRIRALLEDTSENEGGSSIDLRRRNIDEDGEDANYPETIRSTPDPVDEHKWDWLTSICDFPYIKMTSKRLTSKIALDKIFESVEKIFESGATVACSKLVEEPGPQVPTSLPPITQNIASESDRTQTPVNHTGNESDNNPASPRRRNASLVKTPTRARQDKDDCEICSYDGELNFDRRQLALIPRLPRQKNPAAGELNHSTLTTTTMASSRSPSRSSPVAVAREKPSRTSFAAIKGIFRRKKKQYRV